MDFGTDMQQALLDNPFLGDLAIKEQTSHDHTVTSTGAVFMWCDSSLWHHAAQVPLSSIPDDAGMLCTVLEELHATPLGRHFGSKRPCAQSGGPPYPGTWRPLYMALCSVWWPSLPGTWRPLSRRVLHVSVSKWYMACPRDSLLLCQFWSTGVAQSAWTS